LTDIDKLLRSSLNEAADAYDPVQVHEARREFLRRARRRRIFARAGLAFAGAALVGLFVVVSASDINVSSPDRDEPVTGIASARITARIEVGDAPRSVAVTRGSVWVANSGDGTLSRIDALTNEVIDEVDVGGTPSEITEAGGSIWVAVEDQPRVTAVDVDTLAQESVELKGGGTNIDLTPAGEFLWAVSPDTPLQRIDSATGRTIEQALSVDEPVDTAVGAGKVWVLGAEGAIDQVDQASGLGPEVTFSLEAPVDPAASDLAFDGTSLWVADGNSRTIVRVDPHAGVLTGEFEFQGRWAEITTSGGRVWALVGNDSSEATLMLLEDSAGIRSAGTMRLAGGPVGITGRGGSLWVANLSSDSVSHIDLRRGPSSPPVVAGEAIPEDETVFVYPHMADLYASTAEPVGVAITATDETETNPSYLSDDLIVFERTDSTGQVTAVTRDLVTGAEEVTPISGTELSVGSRDQLAWIVAEDDPAEQTRIRMGSLDGSGREFFIGNPEFEPLEARNLEWSSTGEELYYEAGTDEMGLYRVDRRTLETRAIDPPDGGATYLGPSADGDGGLVVLRFCCRGAGGYETVELGRLSFGGGAPVYSTIAGLDDAGFNANARDVTVEFAGGLDVEETPSDRIWSTTSDRSWILSDGVRAWLVDEQGEIDLLNAESVIGLAVNPEFLD
jgi:YVTN family beta-propeller protein